MEDNKSVASAGRCKHCMHYNDTNNIECIPHTSGEISIGAECVNQDNQDVMFGRFVSFSSCDWQPKHRSLSFLYERPKH